VGQRRVTQRLPDGIISVPEFDILAYQPNDYRLFGSLKPGHHVSPLLQVAYPSAQSQSANNELAQSGILKQERYFVDGLTGNQRDNCLSIYIAE
jgi:hypothetical protein